MQDTIYHVLSNNHHIPSSVLRPKSQFSRPRTLQFHSSSTKSTVSLPPKPTKTPEFPSLSPILSQPGIPRDTHDEFQEKMLLLESLGFDFLKLLNDHPPVAAASLLDIKHIVEHLTFMGFTTAEFRRIVGMCPEILTCRLKDITPVFAFLLREVLVPGSDLKRVINRRPRLLACRVKTQLRPTFYFLRRIGIEEINKYTHLLSCSVEEKFIPRIEYFEMIGFSQSDAVTMFRRFPQLFCYSIKDNLEPKINYFVVEMGRDLKELKEFPQYFSFSLERRIKPRHQRCVEKGVYFPLPMLLKTNEARFRDRLELCCSSSMPLRTSPLWCTNCDTNRM